MTSEMASAATIAGVASCASWPPLSAERWRRTAFSSLMVAPALASARVVASFCSSVMPAADSGSSAEPPPEMSTNSSSSADAPTARSWMRLAASIAA